ncbi:MAG TPA: hypothetical protein PKY71_02480, partial [Smithellaceae bacterium]|nr:hypothetical protein [Smithellaceae bacterium]
MGIVYHTNYIRWFEMGRTEFMRQLGISYSQLEELGLNLPLTKVSCHFQVVFSGMVVLHQRPCPLGVSR